MNAHANTYIYLYIHLCIGIYREREKITKEYHHERIGSRASTFFLPERLLSVLTENTKKKGSLRTK